MIEGDGWALEAVTTPARIGRRDEAIPLLNEATTAYERLEALRDVARIQTALQNAGVRRSRPASRRRPSFGWESLTPTELRVISFVTDGLTNRGIAERLFVSPRTIATHLEHVFQKLGHANRVELAADAVRRAATDPLVAADRTAPGVVRASRQKPTRGRRN